MEHSIDTRDMAPPEPMERVLDTLAGMGPEDRLLVRLRREPFPLYDILRRMGYQWESEGSEADVRVRIWQASMDAEEA